MSTTPVGLRKARIHALKAGTWQGLSGPTTLTPADLARIAQSYDPAKHEAPVVIGHPATDDPAWGWVRGLAAKPDGLWAEADLLPETAELFEKGLYRKVSVSLYTPDAPANPMPGGYTLKHVGILGAQPPAVKGLEGVLLHGEDEDSTITLEFQEECMDEEQDTTDLAERESALAAKELAIAKREQDVRRKEWDAQLTPHVTAGRLLPAQKPLMIELMERVHEDSVSFSEGEEAKPLGTALLDFVAALPKQVSLGEAAAPSDDKPAQVSFAAPDGYTVEAEDLEQLKQVQTWLKANPGKTMVDALKALK